MEWSAVMRCDCLVFAVLMNLVVFRAHAQLGSAVVLPTRGDERMTSQREVAQQALTEALTAQGYRVVTHADALAQLPAGARACSAVDCAPSMLRELSLNVAAACAVWLSPDAPEGTVFVTLVDDAGSRFPGAHPVNGGNLAMATRAALAEARGLQLLGPGPWVRIHGTPASAKVIVDGQVVGALPYRAAMTAGRYLLRVESAGHRSEEQTLDLPLNAGRVVEVEVNLEVGEDPVVERIVLAGPNPVITPTQPARTERVAQTGDYLLGGVIALGGVLLMTIDPIHTLAKSGDCADARCRQVYGFSTRSTLQVIGGAALIGLGAVMTFAIQPFAVEVQTGEHSTLSLKASF